MCLETIRWYLCNGEKHPSCSYNYCIKCPERSNIHPTKCQDFFFQNIELNTGPCPKCKKAADQIISFHIEEARLLQEKEQLIRDQMTMRMNGIASADLSAEQQVQLEMQKHHAGQRGGVQREFGGVNVSGDMGFAIDTGKGKERMMEGVRVTRMEDDKDKNRVWRNLTGYL
jgi:hypothetical protein